jgi:hypothetical protein
VIVSPGELLPEDDRHGRGPSVGRKDGNGGVSPFTGVNADDCRSDDGKGSPWSGSLSAAELCSTRRGPSSIGESAR